MLFSEQSLCSLDIRKGDIENKMPIPYFLDPFQTCLRAKCLTAQAAVIWDIPRKKKKKLQKPDHLPDEIQPGTSKKEAGCNREKYRDTQTDLKTKEDSQYEHHKLPEKYLKSSKTHCEWLNSRI